MSANLSTSQSSHVQLAFSVPRGFEDVAWNDILRHLPEESSRALADFNNLRREVNITPLSGYVLLCLPIGEALSKCLDAYAQGHFWSVIRLYLSLQPFDGASIDQTSILPTISGKTRQGLDDERKSLPSKKSRQIQSTDVSKKRLNRFRKRVAPLDIDTTPHELAFIEQLTDIAESQQDSHTRLYEFWKNWKHSPDQQNVPESFAIRFERRSFLFPTLKSSKIAFHLAEIYGSQLQNIAGRESIRADLEHPDYEILAELIESGDNWQYFAGIGLPLPKVPEHRASSRIQGRTTMLSQRAYCLSLLHPMTTHTDTSQPTKPVILLDPCAGAGSIPLELAGISDRSCLKLIPLSADYELPSLEKGLLNSAEARLDARRGLGGIDVGIHWTGYGRGHSGGFREKSLDGIITDLPWGIRELTPAAVARLYPALLRFLGPAVVDGGYGVFLCVRDKIFTRAVEDSKNMWEFYSRKVVNVEGIQAHAFVIRRKNRC